MKITNIKIEKFRLLDNIEINLENIITTVALMLFKNSKFSIEQASHFANLSLYDFMDECKKIRYLLLVMMRVSWRMK